MKQALGFVEDAKDVSASHNCYAYKLGDEYRSSDDGEPGGTAGRPILGSIEGEGLDGVCVLVTRFASCWKLCGLTGQAPMTATLICLPCARYFGGTKLGAGGLVRAYAEAARECLRKAERVEVKPLREVVIQVWRLESRHCQL